MNDFLCRLCSKEIEPFLNFGKMPLANAFLHQEDIEKETFFPLIAGFCGACCFVQLLQQPSREQMFHADYPFLTGSSVKMKRHFQGLAEIIYKIAPKKDFFIVEIGSNDGTFLLNFSVKNIRHIGVEPSKNLAECAAERGVKTLSAFFDKEKAEDLLKSEGPADVIVAANVMCHIPYIHSVLQGVRILLARGGVFCFEDPYLGDMLSKTSYDQIYDEHVFIFSVTAISRLLEQHGMEIFHLEPLTTHGGSMRIMAGRKGERAISPAVQRQLVFEQENEFNRIETYHLFRERCKRSRDLLRQLLMALKKQNKRIMGYGATSKSTTVTNYCGITPDLVEAICDTTPAKQGRLNPGTHIPVVSYAEFKKNRPDYALLFAWNHQEEIFSKEQEFIRSGGNWIVYVPEVAILEGSR